ncbi:MerR family DNA-binding transcriptional regulator [Patescibacteria group bacterium]|nr:MerR family DNA-binding transcriptional regulator [Patescibacteria group bacterium]
MQNSVHEPKSDPTVTAQERLSIGNASEYLGVSVDTLRRWEKKGSVAALRSPGGHRYFIRQDLDKLFGKKYTRTQPAQRRTTDQEQIQVQEKEPIRSEPQVEEKVESPELERIEPALSEPIRPPQSTQEATPQPIRPAEAKHIATSQQAMPAQDTPASLPTTTYQSVSAVPATGLEQKAGDIVKNKKTKKFPWGKALVVGLIIFGVIDVILLIVFLTSSRTPISPIP